MSWNASGGATGEDEFTDRRQDQPEGRQRPDVFRRFGAARFFDALRPGAAARPASLTIAFCCRRISAVQKPRAAPAAVFAALSHALNQGRAYRTLADAMAFG